MLDLRSTIIISLDVTLCSQLFFALLSFRFLSWLAVLLLKWRQYVPSKCRSTSTGLHNVTFQTMTF
jgi:hypothetical protein